MASQASFETVVGRFQNAVSLLSGVPGYTPTNELIIHANLNNFISEIISRNRDVDTSRALLGSKRETRKQLAYKIKSENPYCLENRLAAVLSYLKGDLTSEKSAIKQIDSLLKRIKPVYPRKDPANPLPRGAGKSPSEKSYTSLVGNARSIIAILETLSGYKPSNKNILVDDLKAITNLLEQLNMETTQLLEDYGSAVNAREELYKGNTGLAERKNLIKNYLAALEGGRQNIHYREFSEALKGV